MSEWIFLQPKYSFDLNLGPPSSLSSSINPTMISTTIKLKQTGQNRETKERERKSERGGKNTWSGINDDARGIYACTKQRKMNEPLNPGDWIKWRRTIIVHINGVSHQDLVTKIGGRKRRRRRRINGNEFALSNTHTHNNCLLREKGGEQDYLVDYNGVTVLAKRIVILIINQWKTKKNSS